MPLFETSLPLGWMLYAGWIAVCSVVTLATYGRDKRAARAAKRRTPERTLHLMALLGGFIGGWIGRHGFRHKTRKPIFAVVLTLATVSHVAVAGWLAFR